MNYSVLMSVYYKEKPEFLQQSIESVLNQTVMTDDFVLVCDGPLTDELDGVINQYSSQLNVVRLEQNMGLGNALNEGLLHCKNELVGRMDSDDVCVPYRFEKELAVFEICPDMDIVGSAIDEFCDDVLNVQGTRQTPETLQDIIEFSRKRNPFNHPSVMFRKSAVQKSGGYSEKFNLFEDYHLWVRMLKDGAKACNVQEVLVHMRTGADMYQRRSGADYAKKILAFHSWMKKIGWVSAKGFYTGAVPHAVLSVMPQGIVKAIYKFLRK